MPDFLNLIIEWFWLICIVIIMANANAWWRTGEDARRGDPSLAGVHRRVLRWFVILLGGCFLLMGVAQFTGCFSGLMDLLDQSNPTACVLAFDAAVLGVGLFVCAYIWFFDGAHELSTMPGPLRISGAGRIRVGPNGWRLIGLLIPAS